MMHPLDLKTIHAQWHKSAGSLIKATLADNTHPIMEDNNIMVTAVILIGVGIGVSVLGIMKIVEIFKK